MSAVARFEWFALAGNIGGAGFEEWRKLQKTGY